MQNKMGRKKATMVEVAKRAGVTIGTVSHVINKTASITPETTERVMKAIEELDYKPNSIARALRSGSSNTIGFMVPDVTNDFYSPIISEFTDCAHADGYTTLLVSYQYSSEREALEMERLADKNVDAIILFNGFGDEAVLERMKKSGIPVVLADRGAGGMHLPTVSFDNKATVEKIITLLKKNGYTKIGLLSEALTLSNINDRFEGYLKGLEKNGLEYEAGFVFINKKLQVHNLKKSYKHMKKLLEQYSRDELPQVFFAMTDVMAIGAMKAIKEAGYRVPEDFGIIGFDNIAMADYVDPPLTTVMQDQAKMGREAWKMVKLVVENSPQEPPHVVLPQKLVPRGSVLLSGISEK